MCLVQLNSIQLFDTKIEYYWQASCPCSKDKSNKQSLKIDPGTQKKTGNVKCNQTIIALHFVQYDVLWSTSYCTRPCYKDKMLANSNQFLYQANYDYRTKNLVLRDGGISQKFKTRQYLSNIHYTKIYKILEKKNSIIFII
jgi:hypothetical protein